MKNSVIEQILMDIKNHVEQMMKGFGKLNDAELGVINNFVKFSEKLVTVNAQLDMTKKEWNGRRYIAKQETQTRLESLKLTREINRERIFGKRLLEQEHRDNVQSNIKLRHSLQGMDTAMTRVTKMMHGTTPIGVAGEGIGAAFRMTKVKMQHSELRETMEIVKNEMLNSNFINRTWQQSQDWEMRQQKLRSLQKSLVDTEDTKTYKTMQSNPALASMVKHLEKVGNFMAKHSTGIVISVVSLGLLIGLFKAALTVSPMLQKMLELMSMTFGLILRPFGDFFGFVLRPIAMMFLATVLPFFKDMYPRMMQLGDQIGNSLLPLVGSILGVLNLILGALNFTTDPENKDSLTQARTTLAVGLGSTAGYLGGRRIFNAIQNAKLHGGHIAKGSLIPNFKNMFSQQAVKDALKNVRSQKAGGYAGILITALATLLPLLLGQAGADSVEEMTPEEGGEHNARLVSDPSYSAINTLTGRNHMNNFYGDMIFYENVDAEQTLEQINDGMKTEGDTQLGG